MELADALLFDSKNGAEMQKDIDAIASQLRLLEMKYPNTFQHICEEGQSTGEMTLGDAIAAVEWATNYLIQAE